jgi:cell division protein FtsI (penicillin-binding protein 3)
MRTRRSRARISFVVVTIFAIVAAFTVRLVDIQLVQASELNAQSLSKRAQEQVLYGTRGSILDTNGAVLATSVERYDIEVSPRSALARSDAATSVPEALGKIAALTGQDPAALMAILTADPQSDFAYLTKGVKLDVFEAIRALDIPWVYYELRPSRTYPNGAVAGNLVGFIGTDGPQAGIEIGEDSCLASSDGSASYEKGEDGVQLPGSLVTEVAPKDGGTIRLTIDRDLQFYVQQRLMQVYSELGAEWATAVVMRVSDGHLMAVADAPSVDPNNVDGVPNTALGSRAFSWPYEPGSTIKAVTAASLLDAGVVSQTSEVVAPGRLYLSNGDYIKDAWAHDDTPYTLAGALVDSSNTAVSLFSDLLPADKRHDYLTAFGFNSETEVGFYGESEGVVHPANEWDEVTNYAVQFGQGMSATSVQVASAYQTLANGGVRMPVTLVEGCQWPDGTTTDLPATEGTRVVSETAARQTSEMLEQVVTKGWKSPDLTIPGYRVAAKSGTAQVAEDGIYGDKAVISYAGFAPADNPQYVVVVTAGIPSSIYSSGAIATTFHDVMAQTLTQFRVTPSTEPAPDIPLTW